jgi:platelet-activating factor acetylhydrolase
MSLYLEVKEYDVLVWLMTIRGSIYITQSDFLLLYLKISSLILKMTINLRRAIDLNINTSLEFLKKVIPTYILAINRSTNEHLLDGATLDRLLSEYRLSYKDTTICLYINYKLGACLTPYWLKRYK